MVTNGKSLPEFLRVPWTIKDVVVVFLGAWIILPVMAVLLTRISAPINPWAGMFLQGLRANEPWASFVLVIIDAVGAFGLLLFYLRRYHMSWRSLGWRRFNPLQALGYLVAAFVVFLAVVYFVLTLVSWLDPTFNPNQPQSNDLIQAAHSHWVIAFVSLVVVPPFIEESVFRGFIFPAIAKRWGMVAGAVLSSILFGLAHLQANVTIYTFILGLLLCLMYVRLRSIVPGIVLHMLNNFLAFLAVTGSK